MMTSIKPPSLEAFDHPHIVVVRDGEGIDDFCDTIERILASGIEGEDFVNVTHIREVLAPALLDTGFMAHDIERISVMAGAVVPWHCNPAMKVASELMWYSAAGQRGHSLELLEAFEAWASSTGATHIQMSLISERAEAYLRRVKGYNPYRHTLIRRLV